MRAAVLLAALFAVRGLQDSKVPVPSDDALAQAEKSVRELYKDDYAAKTPADRLRLARKLAETARETKDNEPLRFALFRESCDQAAKAGAVDTLVRSLTELYSAYEIPGVALKAAFHAQIEAAIKPEDQKRLAEADLALVQEALDQDQFDLATKMGQAGLLLARKSKDAALATRAEASMKSVTETKAVFERAKKAEELLAASPEDPAANQSWGEWLCLNRGRWDKGLAFLAKGTDGPLRSTALREFGASSDLASLVDVADGWWEVAEREKNPQRRSQLIAHARSIYTSALPKSSGLVRAKIGKRLEFDADPPAKESPGSKEEEDAVKAEAALAANPNDPAANLALGKYLAFTKNEWGAAMPRFAKGSDAALRGLAEKELAQPRAGAEQLELGDAWADAARRGAGPKKNLLDRAVYGYVQAWTSVDAAAKEKLRDRFRKIFQVAGAPSKVAPKDWSLPVADAKAGVSPAAPRTGRHCFQINCIKFRDSAYQPLSQTMLAKPLASYELSCWVLTDETAGVGDALEATIASSEGKEILHSSIQAPPDQPWYKKLEVKFTAPETAVRLTVGFAVKSIKGTIFIDDVSLRQDGREVLKNGSFEQ